MCKLFKRGCIHYLVPLYPDRVLSKSHSGCLNPWIVLTSTDMRYIRREVRPSLIAQLVRNLLVMQETLVRFLGQEDPLEKDRLLTPVSLGFPGG